MKLAEKLLSVPGTTSLLLVLAACCIAQTNTTYVVGKFSVHKSNENEKKFANTGLAYDSRRDILLIGNCYNNSVEFYSKEGERVRPAMNLSHLGVSGLQGVAYDSSDDTLWVWASARQPKKKTRYMIWHCNMDGEQIDEPFEFAHTPGMISYDPTTDSLWADSYDWQDGYRLYRISCVNGKLEETLEPGKGIDYSEGVGYDPVDGTFWLLGRSHVFHVRKAGGKYELIRKYPNPSENCPEDRAALDKLGQLEVTGDDWSFTVMPDGKVKMAKASGGLQMVIPKRGTIMVEGSKNNDGMCRLAEVKDTWLVAEPLDGREARDEAPGNEITVSRFISGADEGVAVDPTDHTVWLNTDTDKGANRIPDCNRCWRVDPSGIH